MKVTTSIRKRCAKCKIVKRSGVLFVICENPKHSSDKGRGTLARIEALI